MGCDSHFAKGSGKHFSAPSLCFIQTETMPHPSRSLSFIKQKPPKAKNFLRGSAKSTLSRNFLQEYAQREFSPRVRSAGIFSKSMLSGNFLQEYAQQEFSESMLSGNFPKSTLSRNFLHEYAQREPSLRVRSAGIFSEGTNSLSPLISNLCVAVAYPAGGGV